MSAPVLRVLHAVATENFAGVERYVSYVAPELARRGLDVVVLGGDEAQMVAALEGTSVRHRHSASLGAVVRCLLSEAKADVIHAHMTSAEIAAAITKPVLRSRLVVTRHFAARRGSKLASRLAGRGAALVIDRQIAISKFVAEHVEGDTDVLLTGVPRAEAGRHDQPIVLVAQRMEREKDSWLAIEAWALSGLAGQGWRLVFAGDGAERDNLKILVAHHNVSDSVDFIGFAENIYDLMGRASLFLATAPAEPFGLSVVEAMARSLPVVAAAGGGHMETAGSAIPDNMFPPGDAKTAADVLSRLGHDADLRRGQGRRVFDFQRAHLSVERHVDDLLAVYASVTGRVLTTTET